MKTKKLTFEEAVMNVQGTEQHTEYYAEQVDLYNKGAISYGQMAISIQRYETAVLKKKTERDNCERDKREARGK